MMILSLCMPSSQSHQHDFFEHTWHVETGGRSAGGVPRQVAGGVALGNINPEQVDLESVQLAPPSDDVQLDLQSGQPLVVFDLSGIGDGITWVGSTAKLGAVARGIGDVSEEQLTLWTHLKFEVVVRIAALCGNKNLHCVFVV